MKRVLQIVSSLNEGGGVQSMLKSYYSHMDLGNFSSDFVVCGSHTGGMEPWFASLGGHIFHIPPRSADPMGNLTALNGIIKNGHYDVVHCHQDYHGAAAIAMAKRHGVKKRIIHSHQAYPPESSLKKLRREISVRSIRRNATDFAACSRLAGQWLYGSKAMQTGQVILLHNAIEIPRFSFSLEQRSRMREALGLREDTVVLGHVGRFSKPKNHRLLLDVFRAFHAVCDNTALLLVGDGPLRPDMQRQVSEMGMDRQVLFLGNRGDVPELMSAMDLFVLPSRWEGLGIVLIEAQANGLPVACSPYVSAEVKLSDNLFFMDEEDYDDPEAWCRVLREAMASGRRDNTRALLLGGYDIRHEAKKMEKLYLVE